MLKSKPQVLILLRLLETAKLLSCFHVSEFYRATGCTDGMETYSIFLWKIDKKKVDTGLHLPSPYM